MKLKSNLRNLKNVAGIIIWTAAVLSIAAKARKDITIHAKHDEHSPCICDKQCLSCLFSES